MTHFKEFHPCMAREPRRCSRVLSVGDAAIGAECIACDIAFTEDDVVESIYIGPGNNEIEQAKVGKGTYMAICVVAHATCVFGE